MIAFDKYKNYIRLVISNKALLEELDEIEKEYPDKQETEALRIEKAAKQEAAFIKHSYGIYSNHHEWDTSYSHDQCHGDFFIPVFKIEVDLKSNPIYYGSIKLSSYNNFSGEYFWSWNNTKKSILVSERKYLHEKVDDPSFIWSNPEYLGEKDLLPLVDGEHIFIVDADI